MHQWPLWRRHLYGRLRFQHWCRRLQNNILLISTTGGSSVAYNGGVPVANNLISDTVTISLPDGTIRGTYSVPVGYYGLLQNSTSGSPYPDPPYTLEADVYDADGNQLFAEVTLRNPVLNKYPVCHYYW